MTRKHEEESRSGEGRANAWPEGRRAGEGAVSQPHARRNSFDVGEMGQRAAAAGEHAMSRVAEIGDVTAERLGRAGERAGSAIEGAGEAVGEAMKQVEIDEFRLRGTVGGQPFAVDLTPEEGERYLTFEVNMHTDAGDNFRIAGRKHIGPYTGKGYESEEEGEQFAEGTRVKSKSATRDVRGSRGGEGEP